METYDNDLLLIALVAALAPLAVELPKAFRPPIVVVEIILGILIGPHALDWVGFDGLFGTLGQLGLTFLLFMVGMEIDFGVIRGRPLALAVGGWFFSFLVAMVCAYLLSGVGLIQAPPLLAAIALSTTALGVLSPILKDTGEWDSGFGGLLISAAAMGEFGPMVFISLLLIPTHPTVLHTLFMVAFTAVALAAAYFAFHMLSSGLLDRLAKTLNGSGQLPVRLCILLQAALVALAAKFGLNVVMGAFAAGLVVGLVSKGEPGEVLRQKLDAIGYGFLIPIFFIGVGARFDLEALWRGPLVPVQIAILLGLFVLVRGAPVLLYRDELAAADKWPFALYSATGLPLIAVIAELGVSSGLMAPDRAASARAADKSSWASARASSETRLNSRPRSFNNRSGSRGAAAGPWFWPRQSLRCLWMVLSLPCLPSMVRTASTVIFCPAARNANAASATSP